MRGMLQFLRDDLQAMRRYFRDARAEIAEKNLRLMGAASLFTAALLIAFLLLTPFVIRGWRPSLQHLLFFPASIALFAIAKLYGRFGQCRPKVVTALCLFFCATLFTFILLIDALSDTTAPGTFFPMLCIALPVAFILPMRLNFAPVILAECAYVAVVLNAKPIEIAQYDVFSSLVGIGFSLALWQMIARMRIRDYELRMRYRQLSTQDTLSGILNKMAFEAAANRYLRASDRPAGGALIIMDLDDFKGVNDHLGHYTGDRLLRSIGEFLPSVFRTSDLIGRFGGDEFIVLVKGAISQAALEDKCVQIQQKLRQLRIADSCESVTCSIGCATLLESSETFEHLFRRADDALYRAKQLGKNRYQID